MADNDENEDGETLPTELRPDEVVRMNPEEEREELTTTLAPEGFMIKKEDLDQYGYTKGCQGCKAVLRGNTAQTHKPSRSPTPSLGSPPGPITPCWVCSVDSAYRG